MEFLNPAWGLLAIAVPVVIHLLNRFRYRQIDWAAMELLRRALVARSRRVRVEDWILLVLRSLAVALMALAFARLTLSPSSTFGGGGADAGVVVALDGSYSMSHRPGVESRFDRATRRALDGLRTVQPGSPVSIVLMGSRPRILLRAVGYDPARLDDVLSSAAPLPEALQLEACLEQIEALLEETTAATRECYIVTDAQATSWENLSDKARASLRRLSSTCRVYLVPTSVGDSENLGVASFDLVSGALRRGATARFVAAVTNSGLRPRNSVTATLLLDDVPVDQRTIDRVEAGTTTEVPLFAPFSQVGSARLTVRIGEDALAMDDARHAVAEVLDQVRVLCVDGNPSSDPYESDAGYLVTALGAGIQEGEAEDVFVNTIRPVELATQRLSNYHILVLADVPAVHPEQAPVLSNFVRAGGGLVVFVGDHVQPELYNARLRTRDAALLPCELEKIAGEESSRGGWTIAVSEAAHPLCRALSGLRPELLGEARVFRYLGCRLYRDAHAILRLGERGVPLVSETSHGRGRVLLVSTSAGRDWSNLVSHPLYPILLHEAVTYLARGPHEKPFTVGRPILLGLPSDRGALAGGAGGSRWSCRTPGGADFPVQLTWREGQAEVAIPPTESPGFHAIDDGTGARPLYVAVNVDAAESDVKPLLDDRLEAAVADLGVRVVRASEDFAATVRENRVGKELWWGLLLVALAVLVVEGGLARFFTWRSTRATSGQG